MRRALVFLVPLLAYPACREPTQIVVEAKTNVAYRAGIVTSFTVGRPGQTERAEPTTETGEPWDGSTIGTLVVVPGSADDATLAVKLVMGIARNARECVAPDYAGCIVARRRLRYVPNEKLRLPITLFAQCQDVPCDELSTCSALKQCVPVETACDDGTCELSEDAGVRGDAGTDVVVSDGPKDAVSESSSDAANDVANEAGSDGGPSTPGMVDCRQATCSIASGSHCCYDFGASKGTCLSPQMGCALGGGNTDISCDDDSDCTTAGEVCCYFGLFDAVQCATPAQCASQSGKRVCHVSDAACPSSCTNSFGGYLKLCQ